MVDCHVAIPKLKGKLQKLESKPTKSKMPTKNNNSYLEKRKSVPAETSNIPKKGAE